MENVIIIIAGLIGLVLGLVIAFLPTVVAFIKGNIYKKQTLVYQLLLIGAGIVVSIVVGLLSSVLSFLSVLSILWSIFSLVAWVYILINAFRDTEMTILSRFGINI